MNKILLNRKKTHPEKFAFTGEGKPEKISIQLFRYNRENYLESQNVKPDKMEGINEKDYMSWLNVHGIHEPETIALICKKLGVHNLVIQDILDVNQRPKFQEFDDYSFFTIKSVLPSDNLVVVTEQISFVFGKDYLISFQEKKGDYFEHIRFRIRENTGIVRERGADFLLYLMLEAILDNYFKTLSEIEKLVEGLDVIEMDMEPLPSLLRKYEQHKKNVSLIKKTISPIREFTMLVERDKNSFIEDRHLKYFFELKDLCLTLLDNCETLESSLESNINLFFSVQGHRMNQIMKTLTITATIFIPLTFVAGIYGMNFLNMPELEWKYGYFVIWGIFLVIIVIMLLFFRRRKWI